MDAVVIVLLVFYVPLVIISIIGNILIMLTVNVFESMRKPFNVFHGNLALADFLFAITSIFDAVQFVTGETIYSEFTCILTGYLVEASYTVSILTLTVMATDRYEVVDKPLKNKKTIKQNIIILFFVWLFSLGSCSVLTYAYTMQTVNGTLKCVNRFNSKEQLIYYAVQSVFVYLVPMAIMTFCHSKLSKILLEKKKNTILQNLTDDAKLKEHRKIMKVVQLVLILTVTFFLLWSPFIFIRLINHAGVEINRTLDKFSHFCVFCSTANNFVIYSVKRKDFRNSFKRLLCGCFVRESSAKPTTVVSSSEQKTMLH